MKTERRKIRIQMPSSEPGGIADVVDAETGQPLGCRSFTLHTDADGKVQLSLQLIEADAMIEGTWLCTKVREDLIS